MASAPALAGDVGLRHVLEDGLAILSRSELDPGRRQFVLDDLMQLFGDALRGSELLDRTSLLVASADRYAVETYSLIDRYIRSEDPAAVRQDLETSLAAFGALREGRQVQHAEKRKAISFLRQVLTTLERNDVSGILERPDDLPLGHLND